MFIKYQTVRNTLVGLVTATVAGVAAFFGLNRGNAAKPTAEPVAFAVAHDVSSNMPTVKSEAADDSQAYEAEATWNNESVPNFAGTSEPRAESSPAPSETISTPTAPPETDGDRYLAAMQLATLRAPANGKGKDVLGSASPWKLNLYDDNQDGQWDRAKLDRNRDEIDDEKWNFKQGRWEKDGGATSWVGDTWVSSSDTAPVARGKSSPVNPSRSSPELARYRAAMKIATSRAATSGKGKDVLGSSSPWKLNLYDDDGDGQWDRGKLDYNRDEVDDEKWNFKNGRWEKDGGASVWDGSQWKPSKQ